MKRISTWLLLVNLIFVCGNIFAQTNDSTSTTGGKQKKAGKDAQNQLQYLKPDLEQPNYNLNDRVKISKPQMPKLDLPPDSTVYQGTKAKRKQQDAFVNRKYYYPAKPKNQWEVGVGIGSFLMSGDVTPVGNPLKSYGATFTVRKAFGYVFSLRLQYVYGQASGQDWKPKYNSERNPVLNGALYPNIDYVHRAPSGAEVMFHNYRMRAHELSLQGVFTLGNLMFHKERNKVNFYTFLGVGALMYNTKINVLDANNNMYDFTSVVNAYDNTSAGNNFLSSPRRKAASDAVKALLDKTYETQAEAHTNTQKDAGKLGNMTLSPVYSLGFGLGFHASKRVTLNIESRATFTHDDLLDGQQFQEDFTRGGGGAAQTRDYDNYFFNAITVNVHLGKKSLEPLWWLNPMDYTYKKLAEMDPNKIIDELLRDDDEDGVPNKLDKEPNTKKGCPVDPKGIALDSDKDGIFDCDDKEPFSPPGFPIDASGVAKVPCCAEGMSTGKTGAADCSKAELPEIRFADDKYGVAPEYYAHLHEVADKMQMCPDVKIVATGINTDGKYGEQLAWNRVNKAIEYLTTKYGISRDRFIVKFVQGAKTNNPAERANQRRVEFRVAQDGESGQSNPPAPHPGLKAGLEY